MAENNPYVGPASFNDKDRHNFFGRDDEARELSYLLIARRAVLLYAQSGAGKTSLLRARIIPDFHDSREMHVFPITRVSGPEEGANVYLANALAGLNAIGSTLAEALAPLMPEPSGNDDEAPYLLVIDQFEEVFTFHPELTKQRQEFFTQFRECLNAYPKLGLLLAMREDYLADMDSFAGYLPDRLRTRMRMERLSTKQAISAIALPAERACKPFDEGIAEKLAEDLRGVGKYVEPVQLQIVCQQLWSKLPDSAESITQHHYETLARVDDALIRFYRDSLTKAQTAALTERALRRWFGEKLITPAGTRGLIYQGKTETEGLSNEAVRILSGSYIIRPDLRGHDVYYELAHDRLVDPIVKDNLEWKAGYRNPVAEAFEHGAETQLTGTALEQALHFASENPHELTPEENQFLAKNQARETALRQAEIAARKKRIVGAVTAVIVILILAISVVRATVETAAAKTSAKKAKAALVQAKIAECDARASEDRAQSALNDATDARNNASTLAVQSSANAAGGLVNSNSDVVDDLAAILAALRAEHYLHALPSPTPELAADVRLALQKATFGAVEKNRISTAGKIGYGFFSQDGNRIAGFDGEKLLFWEQSGKKLDEFRIAARGTSIATLALSGDFGILATLENKSLPGDGVAIWDVRAHRRVTDLQPLGGSVSMIAMNPNGTLIATVGAGGLRIWNAQGTRIAKWGEFPQTASHVAFSPDGRFLAWYSQNQGARLLDLQTIAPPSGPVGIDVVRLKLTPSVFAFGPAGEELVIDGHLWRLPALTPDVSVTDGGYSFSRFSQLSAEGENGRPVVTRFGGPVAQLKGHNGVAFVTDFGPDDTVLTAGADNTLRVWDVKPRSHLSLERSGNSQILISDTPRIYALSGNSDNEIEILSEKGEETARFPYPYAPPRSIAIDATGSALAICVAGDCSVQDPRQAPKSPDLGGIQKQFKLSGMLLGWSTLNGRQALIAADGATIRIADRTGVNLKTFTFQLHPTSIQMNVGRTLLIAASSAGVEVRDLAGHRIAGFAKHLAEFPKVLPGSDPDRIGILDVQKGTTTLYDRNGSLLADFGSLPGQALSPDGKLLAVGGSGYPAASVFDIATKKLVARFQGLAQDQLSFTSDGRSLISIGSDMPPAVWPIQSTEEMKAAACKWVADYLRYSPNVTQDDRNLCR